MYYPGISNGFGNLPTPHVSTAHELAILGELAKVETELQNKRQQLIEGKKAKIKQMSNRELLEAIYIKLLEL
jgi:hypothetical protein